MKLLLLAIILGPFIIVNALVSKIVSFSAGSLAAALTPTELNTVTNPTLSDIPKASD